jgi:hypothetical protein
MRITLDATDTVDTIDGKIQARIWQGTTDAGVAVKAWIVVIQPQTHDLESLAAFDAELKLIPAARRLVSFDLRLAV